MKKHQTLGWNKSSGLLENMIHQFLREEFFITIFLTSYYIITQFNSGQTNIFNILFNLKKLLIPKPTGQRHFLSK